MKRKPKQFAGRLINYDDIYGGIPSWVVDGDLSDGTIIVSNYIIYLSQYRNSNAFGLGLEREAYVDCIQEAIAVYAHTHCDMSYTIMRVKGGNYFKVTVTGAITQVTLEDYADYLAYLDSFGY